MNHSLTNDQHMLAEQVVLEEMQINHACYEALLKIQRWKFILQIPGIAARIAEEANQSIRRNFFTFIPQKFVLADEEYSICTEN